jgi:hypothetical protein
MIREVLAREFIIDSPTLVVVLGQLLLLVPNAILNNPGVNHHREVVSFVREIIETHPEVKSLKDCARRPAAVTKALSFEPAKDCLTQLRGAHGSLSRPSSSQMLVPVISAAPHPQLIEDTRRRAQKASRLSSWADGAVCGRSRLAKHALVSCHLSDSGVLSESADARHRPRVGSSWMRVQEVVPTGKLRPVDLR